MSDREGEREGEGERERGRERGRERERDAFLMIFRMDFLQRSSSLLLFEIVISVQNFRCRSFMSQNTRQKNNDFVLALWVKGPFGDKSTHF